MEDLTTQHEAKEFIENNGKLLTTSCCPSFVNIIEKHVPTLKDHVSHTPSPMVYTAEIAKKMHPNAQTVFVGPCMAKKAESFKVNGIDMVINFEELDAMLMAAELDPATIKTANSENKASDNAWGFAVSGGVLSAVQSKLPEGIDIKPTLINGLDKKSIRQLSILAKKKEFNFIEGMSCEGGCVGGCYMNVKPMIAQKRMQKVIDDQGK